MYDTIATPVLTILTLLAFVATVRSMGRLVAPTRFSNTRKTTTLLKLCTLGAITLFVYRAVLVHEDWQPLQSHVDGLLLIASLFALTVQYLQHRGGMPGIVTFAMPVLTLILAWAVCASAWTFYVFEIDSVWKTVHLASVYLGTLFFTVAAIAGGMFLYVQSKLRHKQSPTGDNRLASLEAVEGLIISSSALGFGLLTLGLVMGMIMVTSGPTLLGTGWWHSPKVILATTVWFIYALVMNTRHTATFRGNRAAGLSIIGFVLLIATFGAVNALSNDNRADTPTTTAQTQEAP